MVRSLGATTRLRERLADPETRRFGLRVLVFEAITLSIAALLATGYGLATGTSVLDAFYLVSFVIFVLLLLYAFLSAPGSFSRPRLTPLDSQGRPFVVTSRRQSRRDPAPVREMVVYAGLAFLFLVLATLLGRLVGG